MPQSEGGYISLISNGSGVGIHGATNGYDSGGNGSGIGAIYQSTTEPTGPSSMFESMRRAIGQVVGGSGGGSGGIGGNSNSNSNDTDNLLLQRNGRQPIIVGARERDKINGKLHSSKMPSAPTHTAEEARLLGTMPVDPMDDIELRSVQLQFPNARGSIVEACDHRTVPTDKGDLHVAIQGDTAKPAIMTYHDLGLNYASSFAGFFNFPLMRGLLENFCVYHVTAPGQEDGAPTLPEDYVYPTMEDLASQLLYVLSHFGLKSVIGFGVGAGANIMARFALAHPDKVGAVCLINCVSTQSGWIEWGYQSFNARFLRTKGMTQSVVDYLMWHHFGRNPEERNHDLVQVYKQHFERGVNPTNLALFINSYIHRNDLNIARTPPSTPGTPQQASANNTLKMPVMNITGALSPHVDDTVTFNGRLDPTNSSWMKISDCAMVLEEQPAKLAEAFRLFLQGEGYATPLSTPASSPCGTKYQTYSSIFFANFREEQLKQQQDQQQQSDGPRAIRSSVRLCRETAINNNNTNNNNNNNNADNSAGSSTISVAPNKNNKSKNTSNKDDFTNLAELVDINSNGNTTANKRSTGGVAKKTAENSSITATPTVGTAQEKGGKMRITENPLPEPVSC